MLRSLREATPKNFFSSQLHSPSSAGQPSSSLVYSFHAYNVGWNFTDKKRTAQWLGKELVQHWHEHGFNAIGISEVFEIEYAAPQKLHVDVCRKEILASLLKQLNECVFCWLARLPECPLSLLMA